MGNRQQPLERALFGAASGDREGARDRSRAGQARVQVPDGDFSKATVAVTIDASSIETGVADRDAHLKSADFFDVAQYPELRFVGKRVEPRSGAEIDVVG